VISVTAEIQLVSRKPVRKFEMNVRERYYNNFCLNSLMIPVMTFIDISRVKNMITRRWSSRASDVLYENLK